MSTSPMELTLVVAATRDMGIGRNGTLPWTGLRKEMAYFARVTKRLPPRAPPHALNAIIMGRKTWESIPPKLRPLKGRLNVVLSRSWSASSSSPSSSSPALAAGPADPVDPASEPVRAGSLAEAVVYLRERLWEGAAGSRGRATAETVAAATTTTTAAAAAATTTAETPRPVVGRVFVIGGAQIYRAAMEGVGREADEGGLGGETLSRRVLFTRVLAPHECDTFFPLDLTEGKEGGGGGAGTAGWTRKTKGEYDAWVGEDVPGVQEENGTPYQFEMWEREREGEPGGVDSKVA